MVLGMKRVIDFLAIEDYEYDEMVPLMATKPIREARDIIKEAITLTVSQLTILDEILNPFDDLTKEYIFADVKEISYYEIRKTEEAIK